MKKMWASKNRGFTIVELLVVVVVIAILAAITIVSYNGIQQQAKNASISSVVDAWEKALRLAIINGESLPPAGACLGKSSADFPNSGDFPANVCLLQDGASAGMTYSDSNFSSWVKTTKPGAVMPTVTYAYSGATFKSRGIWVYSSDTTSTTKNIAIAWLAQADGSCARGTPGTVPIAGSLAGGYCYLSIQY